MQSMPPDQKDILIYTLTFVFVVFGIIVRAILSAARRTIRDIAVGFFIGIPVGMLGVWVALEFTKSASLAAVSGMVCGIIAENIIRAIMVQGERLPDYLAQVIGNGINRITGASKS